MDHKIDSDTYVAKLLAALRFVELFFYGKKRQVFIHIRVLFDRFPAGEGHAAIYTYTGYMHSHETALRKQNFCTDRIEASTGQNGLRPPGPSFSHISENNGL